MEVVWFKNICAPMIEPLKRPSRWPHRMLIYTGRPGPNTQPNPVDKGSSVSRQSLNYNPSYENGGRVTRRSEALGVLKRLHSLHPITTVWSHQETGTFASFQRDIEVKHWLREVEYPGTNHATRLSSINEPMAGSRPWHRNDRRAFEADLSHARWHPVVETGEMTPVNLPRASYGLIQSPLRNPQRLCCTLPVRAGRTDTKRAMSSRNEGWEARSRLPYISAGSISMREVYQTTQHRLRTRMGPREYSLKRSVASFGKRPLALPLYPGWNQNPKSSFVR